MMAKISTTDLYGEKDSFHDNEDDTFYDNLVKLRRSLNIMSVIGYCLAFVLGVLGNGVVIWVTGFKMKKTVNTVWFLNLAVADFLLTACLPLTVTYLAMDFHWPFGHLMCKLHTTITFLNIIYIYICVCVCVHFGCRHILIWTPYFVFRDTLTYSEDDIRCFNNFTLSDDFQTGQFRHQAVAITNFLLGLVVPFTVIVSGYAVIIHRLRRNCTLSSQLSRPLKIIAAVITTFFLCWAPFHIMHLSELVHHTGSQTLGYVLYIGLTMTTSTVETVFH
uniref:Formyl peptide receptor 1 n=1 Tax=Seriola lalandi dorsalis TaxID=1841481 RepID=A0A3B4XNU7_SERLL